MNQFNRVMGFAALACLLVPVSAFADSWTCVHNNLLREVKIQYAGSAPVPCSVVYNKPDEGDSSQVLWTADNQEGYCEEQAQGFVAKLESWGWTCVNDAAVMPDETGEPSGATESDDATESGMDKGSDGES